MSDLLAAALSTIEPIDLRSLNDAARLQTRKDRKYIVPRGVLADVLEDLPADLRALEIDGRRWFGYESVYFDTPHRDSYRQAATRRPRRFKVRTRSYLDSGDTMLEVKTKNRRGRTVKHRRELPTTSVDEVKAAARRYASHFDESAPYADQLDVSLTSRYRRLTLVLPSAHARATVDAGYRGTDADGSTIGLDDELIVETKTSGAPSAFDRCLWRAGVRPVKISKFATGLAALHPHLPSNRWHPVLRDHFGRPPVAAPGLPLRAAHNRVPCAEPSTPTRPRLAIAS